MVNLDMWADDLGPHGVELTFSDDHATIALSGAVDVGTGSALLDAATSAVARYRQVEISLHRATAIDDSGLLSLLKVKRFADAHRARVALVGGTGAVAEALVASGIGSQFGF